MPALFNITVQDVAARENLISEKCGAPARLEPFYHYLLRGIDLPVVHVEIALPLYRMANWRTRTKQMTYVRREQLGHDFFQVGEENVTVQRNRYPDVGH